MNREIKFRVWDKKENKWLMGYEYDNLGGFSLFGEIMLFGEWSGVLDKYLFSKENHNYEDLVVMQYTGLKDKNGKEIYEGDICYPVRNTEPYVVAFGTHETCEGDYYSSTAHGFYLKAVYPEPYISERSLPYYHGIEIIGNIYENPELSTNKD